MTRAWLFLALAGYGLEKPDDRPEDLVRRLGSAVFAEREGAARALEQMGRPALPSLVAARDYDDPEVRSRAAVLASSIQERLLVEPTRVLLDFEDRPIAEAARILSERLGAQVLLGPENQPQWQTLRVTVKADEPLPFWAALDRFCEATRTQYQPTAGFGMGMGPGPIVRIQQGLLTPMPTSDHGPFRCILLSLHHHRDLTFQRGPASGRPGDTISQTPVPQINDQFTFALQIFAEPRLLIRQTGTLRLTEALDERGRSLVPTEGNLGGGRADLYFGMNAPMSGLQLQAQLLPPAEDSRKLSRLRGVIPLTIATPRPNPLSITLADAVGKSFTSEDATISIDGLHIDAKDQPRTIDLTVKPNREDLAGDGPFELAGPRAHFALQTRFQLLNAQGQPLRIVPNESRTNDGRTVSLKLTLPPTGDQSAPVELRFHDLVSTSTEVPFEFRDLPIP